MDDRDRKLLSKKNIIAFLVVGILLLAVPVGVRLVKEQQFLRSRAAGFEIRFSGDSVTQDSQGNYTTSDPTVDIDLYGGPPVQR